MWKAAPDTVKIIDVRTPEGSRSSATRQMAWNVPIAFVSYQRKKAGEFTYAPQMNAAFVAQVKEIAKPSDTLLVTCRSGGRGAMGVNQLAAAGFPKAWNIVDGIEGDTVNDPAERLSRQKDEERLEERRRRGSTTSIPRRSSSRKAPPRRCGRRLRRPGGNSRDGDPLPEAHADLRESPADGRQFRDLGPRPRPRGSSVQRRPRRCGRTSSSA